MNSQQQGCALVTGAARGIGRAVALELGAKGRAVAVVDMLADEAEQTAAALRKIPTCPGVIVCRADVGDAEQVSEVCRSVESALGPVDVLVNNAGVGGPFHRVDEVSDEEWAWIFNTNVKSVFAFARALLPGMKARHFGRIINIASVQGMVGAALSSTYVATKHAVIGYTRSIATEWGPHGITCNAVCPGYVTTSMGAQDAKVDDHTARILQRTPVGSMARPEDIARWVAFLAGRDNAYTNGGAFAVDGGILASVGIT